MRALRLLLFASSIAFADDGGIARCRTVADPTARLACYDALELPSRTSNPASSAPATLKSSEPPASRQTSAPQTTEQFGFEQKQSEALLPAIQSHIPGRLEGWGPGTSFRFANGQVWQVSDGSSGVHWIENPKVSVRRGALGAFYLEIEGTNRSPRVRRVS